MPFAYAVSFGSPAGQLRASGTFAHSVCPHRVAEWQGSRFGHDRIRLAYFSSDFRAHATGYVMAELFERHDRTRFETIAVSFGFDDGSEMQSRFGRSIASSTSEKSVTTSQSRPELKSTSPSLKGFTDSRPGIFALRPAPRGGGYMGFRRRWRRFHRLHHCRSDHHSRGEHGSYSEKVVYLPDSTGSTIQKRISGAHAEWPKQDCRAGFVFCCFNNNYKIHRTSSMSVAAAAQGRGQRALAVRRQSGSDATCVRRRKREGSCRSG